MYIHNIVWLDEPSSEAVLTISDGDYSLTCFSCPCEYSVGDIIEAPLECLSVSDIEWVDPQYSVIHTDSKFSYIIIGEVLNIADGLVRVGKITLHINSVLFPKDIYTGQFVRFCVSRIDLF